MWLKIEALVRALVLVRLLVRLLAVLVGGAFLLLWECLGLEGGAALEVGVLRVRAGEVLAGAVVSYALPWFAEKADSNRGFVEVAQCRSPEERLLHKSWTLPISLSQKKSTLLHP